MKYLKNSININYIKIILIAALTIVITTGAIYLQFSQAAISKPQKNIIFTANSQSLILKNTWEFYKTNSILDGDKNVDKSNNTVTIEAQSYALLRASIMNDKKTFDAVYNWTKSTMQVRPHDKLFGYRVSRDSNNKYTQVELSNASDGDLDVGLALVSADRKWGSNGPINYSNEIKELTKSIFKNSVVELNGNLTLLPYNSQKWKGIEVLNPSYFSPGHYKLFSGYDPDNNWGKLANDTYNTLEVIKSKNGLYPDWIVYDYKTNQFRDAQGDAGQGAHLYGYDAFRIFWRLGLDQILFNNTRAANLINIAKPFFENQLSVNNTIYSQYDTLGNIVNHGQDQAIMSGAYIVLATTKSTKLPTLLTKFNAKVNTKNGIYGADENYYSQNWGWFTLAHNSGIKKFGF